MTTSFFTLMLEQTGYPRLLQQIDDPPMKLYGRGDPACLLWEPAIAMIGSRHPTPYGQKVAQQLSRQLAKAGFCLVSGLALGIDSLAHEGALEVGGKTIAVLGSAIDRIQPPSRRSLGLAVEQSGVLISEYPPGTELRNHYFAARNRLISGLAQAVIIVEAGEGSGTLITAKCALEQGREVLAIPGPIDSPLSHGTNQLIRQGARLVTSLEDIVEDLNITLQNSTLKDISHDKHEDKLMNFLSQHPLHIDDLMDRVELPADELGRRLLELEMSGDVEKLPGQRYITKH